MGTCTSVSTGHIGIVEKWGKFSNLQKPGCVILVPCRDQMVKVVDMRLRQLYLKCESKTKDNVFVTIEVSVHYRVVKDKVKESYYELSLPKDQIRAYVFDVVRAEVPKKTLDEIFEDKEELALAVKDSLCKTMSTYGYQIVATPVTDIAPDREVKHALNQKQVQKNLRAGMEEKAMADKMVQICNAEARAEEIRIHAQAEADAKFHAGEGLSRQRQAIVDGLAESVKHFKLCNDEVDAKEVMDLIMLTQYFDMMQTIGTSKTGTNTIFIPHNPAAVGDLASQLRQGFLEGAACKDLKQPRKF